MAQVSPRASSAKASPLPASSHPSSAVLCVSAGIRIAAAPSHSFSQLRDTQTWPTWNSFCPRVDIEQPGSSKNSVAEGRSSLVLRNGTKMTLHVRMAADKPDALTETKLVVTACSGDVANADADAEGLLSVTWSTAGMSRFALRTERTNEFRAETWEDASGQVVRGCRYATMEVMTGPLAYVVKNMYGDRLQEVFEKWAEDFAAWAEETLARSEK